MGAGIAMVAPHALPGALEKIGATAATQLPLKARAVVPISLELLEDSAFPAETYIRQVIERQARYFGEQEGRTFEVVDVRRLDQWWVDLAYYEDEDGVAHRTYPGQAVYFGELLEVKGGSKSS